MTCAQSDACGDKAAGRCDLGILCRRAAAMQCRVSTLQLQRQSPQHPSKSQSGPIDDPSNTINWSCYLQTVSSSQFVGSSIDSAGLDCLPYCVDRGMLHDSMTQPWEQRDQGVKRYCPENRTAAVFALSKDVCHNQPHRWQCLSIAS